VISLSSDAAPRSNISFSTLLTLFAMSIVNVVCNGDYFVQVFELFRRLIIGIINTIIAVFSHVIVIVDVQWCESVHSCQ
jgi:hypothetical protein